MDHLYIRHTVGGRLFLDSKKHELTFDIQPADSSREGWKISIYGADQALANNLVQHRDELNIFIVPEGSNDRKTWFFSTHGLVELDDTGKELIIWADGRIDYNV